MISMLGVILAKSRESSWPAIIQISCPLSDKNYLLILMFDCPVSQGLASGIKKIVGLWIFSSNYEILEPFFMSLEVYVFVNFQSINFLAMSVFSRRI